MRHPSNPDIDANDNVLSAEDWLGNRFSLGDKVMYCIGAGRGQMMAIGQVKALRINENTKTTRVKDPNSNPSDSWHQQPMEIPTPQNEWLVEVQVLTERTSGLWGNGQRTRPAWVNEMNITAITGIERTLI